MQNNYERYPGALLQPLVTWPPSDQTVVCVQSTDSSVYHTPVQPNVYHAPVQPSDIETDVEKDTCTPVGSWWQSLLNPLAWMSYRHTLRDRSKDTEMDF